MFLKILFSVLLFFAFFVLLVWFAIARPFTFSSAGEPHDINVIELKEKVRIISQDFFPRNSDNPQVLNKAAAYIFKEFSIFSSRVSYQDFEVAGKGYRNVVAKFGPETGKIIVIGAHYDSFAELPGADDNATGVVGLIELARMVDRLELEVQLQLVAYTLEEPPFFATEKMGSYIHAKSLNDIGAEVELMIALEMIGYFSDERGSQKYPVSALQYLYPQKGNFIAVVDQLQSNNAFKLKSIFNRSTNIDTYSINVPAGLVGVDFSDHRNYWKFDYPAVMVTDTAFYRNTAYHTPYDTYDTLNYEKMAEVIYGVFKYLEGFSINENN